MNLQVRTIVMFIHREDTTAWLGETQDKKIGFFKSEHVEEVAGYDIMDGMCKDVQVKACLVVSDC